VNPSNESLPSSVPSASNTPHPIPQDTVTLRDYGLSKGACGSREIVESARRDGHSESTTYVAGTSVKAERSAPSAKPEGEVNMGVFGKGKEGKALAGLNAAEEAIEKEYAVGRRTMDSPSYQGLMKGRFDSSLFDFSPRKESATVVAKREEFISIVRKHALQGTILEAPKLSAEVLTALRDGGFPEPQGKISKAVIQELAKAGYFGQIIPPEYGGLGFSKAEFAQTITEVAKINATVAGLSSVHQSIGAVDPLLYRGTEEQKQRLLPALARGEILSGFGLTEPGAGSDVYRVMTRAVAENDYYIVDGEKLFITNAQPGHRIGLIARLCEPTKPGEAPSPLGEHAIFIVDLPDTEATSTYRIKNYPLHALKNTYNNGLVFEGFRVSKDNLIDPSAGGTKTPLPGISMFLHGLGNGRVSLLANAGGVMAALLRNFSPWVETRESFGRTLDKHNLVQARQGRTAAAIVTAEALREFCARLIDKGFRAEMECLIAKIVGSEAQKEIMIEQAIKTHGGRSLLVGHMCGDNLHEVIAALIYEGEGDMLRMALFKKVIDWHLNNIVVPAFKARDLLLKKKDIRGLGVLAKAGAVGLGWFAARGVTWLAQKAISVPAWAADYLANFNSEEKLAYHARNSEREMQNSWLRALYLMGRYRDALKKEESIMAKTSQVWINQFLVKVVAEYGKQHSDPVVRLAAELAVRERQRLASGKAVESDADTKLAAKVGKLVEEGKFPLLRGTLLAPMMKPYDANNREVAMETAQQVNDQAGPQ